MGLIATMREIKDISQEDLNRVDGERPLMVDGSLSEIMTQALNIAYSKKDFTSGEPYYGEANPTGNPPPGAGGLPNILSPDSPKDPIIRPSLEGMQQMNEVAAQQLASVIGDAVNASLPDATQHLHQKPLLVYALPSDGNVPVEMSANIDMYRDSGAVNFNDFVFVYTDTISPLARQENTVVDVNQKVMDYEGKGARVYPDLQSFMDECISIRKGERKKPVKKAEEKE